MPEEPTECPRCKEVNHFGDMRFRSFKPVTETRPDGTQEVWTFLCEDCHREVVRS